MKKVLFFVVTFVLLNTNSAISQWQQCNGPYGGWIKALAISGSNIFVGTTYGGVSLSTNNGTSWSAINNGLTNNSVYSLAISGSNIFAGTTGGVFLSTNNGTSWTAVNNGLTNLYIYSLAISGSNIFVGTSGGGVFLSTNNGTSWSAVNNGLTSTSVRSIAISGSNIFAGTVDGGGVFLSTNNGTSWSAVNSGLTNKYIECLAISGSNIFAGTQEAGVFLSTNNGTSWSAVNNGLTSYFVQSIAISGSNIFAGTGYGGVFLSINNGTSWSAVNNGLTNNDVESIAISGSNIFAGTYGLGVFLSTNNGTSWTEVNNGLTNTLVISLAISGSNIFAGTTGGVFLSTNNGTSWTEVNNGLTSSFVYSITISGSNIFAGTYNRGIFLSTNNGTSWTAINNGLTNNTVYSIAISGSNVFAGTDEEVFLSTNNGTSWVAVTNWLPNTYVKSLAISGSNIFAGTSGGVFLSTNNGTSWTEVNNGLTNNSVTSLAISGSNIFAGTYEGVIFLSTNNGTSWTAVTNGLTSTEVTSIAISGSNIFAGTTRKYSNIDGLGVFLSTNNGTSWTAINNGLTDNSVNSLAFNGSNIFAGTSGHSVFIANIDELLANLNSINISSMNPLSYCQGSDISIQFTITGTYNSGNIFTVQLSDANGSFAGPTTIGTLSGTSQGTINTIIPVNTPAGTSYRVRVISSNPVVNGNDNGTDITVYELPQPPIISNQNVSFNATTTLTPSGPANCNFKWYHTQTGGTAFATQASLILNNLLKDTIVYVESENQATGCISSTRTIVSVTVQAPSSLIINLLSSIETVCEGKSKIIGIDGAMIDGTAPYTYSWNPTTGLSNPTDSVTYAQPTSTTDYTLTVTDKNSRTGDAVVRVNVNPLPQPPIISNQNISYNGTAILTPSGPANCIFRWYNSLTGGTAFATQSSLVLNNLLKDTVVYVESENQATGCISSTRTRVSVTVQAPGELIIYLISSSEAVCEGKSKIIGIDGAMIDGTAPYTYSWNPTTGLSNPNDSVTYAQPTSTTDYTLTVTDKNSRTGDAVVRVNVNPLPQPPIISNQNIAYNGTATLTPSGPANCNFKWYHTQTGGTAFATQSSLVLNNLLKDTIVYVESENQTTGCISSTRTRVTVTVQAPSELIINLLSDSVTICEGDSVQIGINGAMTDGTAPYTYNWNPTAGLSNPNDSVTWAKPAQTTDYTLTVTDKNSRTADAIVSVTVNPKPATPVITQSGDTLSASPGVSFEWFLEGTKIPNVSSAKLFLSQSGNYSVIGINDFGCKSDESSPQYYEKEILPDTCFNLSAQDIVIDTVYFLTGFNFSKESDLQVTNECNKLVLVDSLKLLQSKGQFKIMSANSFSISALGTADVIIRFEPKGVGEDNAIIEIYSGRNKTTANIKATAYFNENITGVKLSLVAEPDTAFVGEEIKLKLKLIETKNLRDELYNQIFDVKIRVNNKLLHKTEEPVAYYHLTKEHQLIIKNDIQFKQFTQDQYEWEMMVLLADVDSCALEIIQITPHDSTKIQAIAKNGSMFYADICKHGGNQLIMREEDKLKLYSLMPNPVTESGSFKVELKESGDLNLEIVDIFGQKIKTIYNGQCLSGEQEISFDIKELSSGTYFINGKALGENKQIKFQIKR